MLVCVWVLQKDCIAHSINIADDGSPFKDGISAPHRPYKKPGLGWPGYQAGGTLRPGRPGGARPNAQYSVDCSQIGIARSPCAPDHILSSSPTCLFVFLI